ncbi:SDR family NAD(P)-dependent oxidoreductase [Zeaxanthinibacter enoshimensis]|uniref:Short-subunit dehydrogenase n=1 Tax=Zeaxanthinibacter enoshimensis TaxID=392009 RepID=A0A4R6TLC1_9FLAO|nr:SDR family oxidoreductase [Zeaxanthinibacter enoshimensis]TDQ28951.1 short-subunit dehydrogenase [Zeaxanthinibacter enoshimensis]
MANIIVTGSSRGIGFQLAKLLAEDGHKILAISRNDKPVKELNNPNITALSLDICSSEDLEEFREYLEKEGAAIDILINNAGSLVNKPFLETTPEDFKKVYDVNVFGLAALTQLVIPFMGSGGHVLTISSMGGIQGSSKFPGLAAYSSSKGAVITLTELLAEEFKDSGPSFNALALGAVQTEMLEAAFPGYQAPTSAAEMASYIADFALNGHKFYNGKVLQVSNSTP